MALNVKSVLIGVIVAGAGVIGYVVYSNSTQVEVAKVKPENPLNTPNFDPLKQTKSASENEVAASNAQITFEKYEHDFGNIMQNTENKFIFSFTNTGTEPLIVEDAKGSCGCTAPNFTREPVAPGEKGTIEIVYKPGTQKNQQSKTVTVTTNANPKTTVLKIKANVLEFGA